MGVSFQCGNCGKGFDVGYESAGKTGRCKRCGVLMTIPLASTSVPVPPLSPAPKPIPPPAPRTRGPRGDGYTAPPERSF